MKKVVLFFVAIWWFIRIEEVVLSMKRVLKKEYLKDTKKNRRFAALNQGWGKYYDVEFIFYKLINMGNDRTGKPIMLMALPNPDASVEAYLLIPKNHGKAVVRMNDIVTGCTGNIYVSILPANLTAASALIELYNKAHGAARTVTLNNAVAALEVFMAEFQAFANLPANKANSIVIIQSGNFHVKGVGGGHPSIWDAFRGKLAGEVDMTFVTGAGTCCYDPWYSLDGVIWVRMDPTIYNHATLTGMVPGSWIWVRYQLFDADGAEGFHPAIKVQAQS